MYYNKLARRLSFGLPREIWVVQAGVFLNMFGYGAVLPFELIYLHSARHFSLAVAGLVVATITGSAIAASFPAGTLVDSIGPRNAAVIGLALLALGYGGLAFATTAWEAFAAALVAGCGNGVVTPSQSALVAALVPRELRHRSTAVSRVVVNIGIASGGVVGGIVATTGNGGLSALFLVNAATYLAYALLLRVAVDVAVTPRDAPKGSYRRVFADRPFLTLAFAHIAFIAVGWGLFSWVVPLYAQRVGLPKVLIGGLLLVNGVTVIFAQFPIVKKMEGSRRTRSIALAGVSFVLACGCALVAEIRAVSAAILILSSVLVAVGECLYIASLTPLVADLAPPEMLGRYMSCIAVAWSLGLAAAPAAFTPLIGVSPRSCFLIAAGMVVAATVAVLLDERRLPDDALRTQVVSA